MTALRETALARIEALARQLCRNAGHNPDCKYVLVQKNWQPMKAGDMLAYPECAAFPGPLWHAFTAAARDALQALAEIDAQ
jgi:hypothetical protein